MIRQILALGVFTSGSALAAPAPETRPPDQTVTYRKTEEAELKLEIFRPEGWKASDQRPAIIFFFGGGWVGGTTKQFYPQATRLSARGMVAFCAEYRVKNQHQTSPFDAVEDAKAALRWLWRNANSQGIDRDKIVAAGGSAGGHLAACSAVVPGFDDVGEDEPTFIPAALVLFNPVIDTSPEGYGYNRLRKRYPEISPLAHVGKEAPPTLMMVGAADTTTPPVGHRAFAARMKTLDRRCRLELYEGEKHGFFNPRGDNRNYWGTLKDTEEFLEEFGFLTKEDPGRAEGSE